MFFCALAQPDVGAPKCTHSPNALLAELEFQHWPVATEVARQLCVLAFGEGACEDKVAKATGEEGDCFVGLTCFATQPLLATTGREGGCCLFRVLLVASPRPYPNPPQMLCHPSWSSNSGESLLRLCANFAFWHLGRVPAGLTWLNRRKWRGCRQACCCKGYNRAKSSNSRWCYRHLAAGCVRFRTTI